MATISSSMFWRDSRRCNANSVSCIEDILRWSGGGAPEDSGVEDAEDDTEYDLEGDDGSEEE